MNRFQFFFLIAALSVSPFSRAQRECGTMDYYGYQKANDPSFELRQADIERFTNEFVSHYSPGDRALVTIPVVVHVVWNTTAENISDAQIQSQIAVLNSDFRKLNADAANTPAAFQSLVADANIEFCLASIDPNGAGTTGITRTQTSVTSFATNNSVKFASSGGKDAWPATKYLNLWVCDISGGILGYAQFPGGSASTDGVVCDYQYFGTTGTATAPFNKGRTATHEVGHWLNLRHIWGDASCGNDLVSDTPTQQTANYGCPAFPRVTCTNGPNGDMFMNYMDYTDDACMYMFSVGQSARMQALFASGGARAGLLTSNGCGSPGPVCAAPSGLASSGQTASSASLSWSPVSGALSYNLRYKLTSSVNWTNATGLTGASYNVSGLLACSNYEWQVQTVCSSTVTGSFSASATFVTSGCVATYCASAGQSTADEWINRVVVNTIDNTSGNNLGYANYTALSTTLATNSTYTFSGTPGFSASAYSEFWGLWIDYNGDLDFADAGETVLLSTTGSGGTVSGSFTIPSAAVLGTTRMRIGMKYGAAPSACETFQYGEVEDYTVSLVAGTGGGACNANYEDNDNINQTTAINLSTYYYSYICPAGDEDWYRFSNSSTQKNIRITLESVPANYDLYLYNPSGVLVASSLNAATANETIVYNNGPVGTYKVKVSGVSGATNGSDSYMLRATRRSTAYRLSGEEEILKELEVVTAYPNPTSGLVDVRFSAAGDGQVEYRIYDLMGRQIQTNRFTALEGESLLTIDLSNQATGTYLLVLTDGSALCTTRIMKE